MCEVHKPGSPQEKAMQGLLKSEAEEERERMLVQYKSRYRALQKQGRTCVPVEQRCLCKQASVSRFFRIQITSLEPKNLLYEAQRGDIGSIAASRCLNNGTP